MQSKTIFLALIAVSTIYAASGDVTVRTSANKAAQLIERSIAAVAPNVPCASCHHSTLPLWALSVARDHGIAVNADLDRRVAVKTYSFLQA